MRVFITPCDTSEGGWNHGCLSLQRVAELADRRVHNVVSSADEAQIVIVTDMREDDHFGRLLRANSIVKRYPDKSFVYDRTDRPIGFVRGVYTSPPRTLLDLGRYQTGCYLTAISEWRNPFVSADAETSMEKDLLFSFVGRNSSPVRGQLLAHNFGRSDVVVTDVSSLYDHWDGTSPQRDVYQRRYVDISKRSRFVLCPRGHGNSSERLFEVMEMGLVPVILSDGWVPPRGPRWQDFSVTVLERDVTRLVPILERYGDDWFDMGHNARQNWLDWFSPPKQFNYIVDSCIEIMGTAKVNEKRFRRAWPLLLLLARTRRVVNRLRTFAAARFSRRRHVLKDRGSRQPG